MTPTRLLQEFTKINSGTPIICITRSNERKKNLLNDLGLGLFGYFDPTSYNIEELVDLLKHAKSFNISGKKFLVQAVRHFNGLGFEKVVGISEVYVKSLSSNVPN